MAVLLRIFGALLLVTALALALSRAPDRPVETLVARWALPPSDFIEVRGQVVHLRDEGPRDDPLPLVLIHGTSASLHTWEGWVAALKGQRRIISFDLPGFGLTGPSLASTHPATTAATPTPASCWICWTRCRFRAPSSAAIRSAARSPGAWR